MPYLVAIVIAVVSGILLTVQVAANRRLGDALVKPFSAASVSFIVGLSALALAVICQRTPISFAGAAKAPWWSWIGGLMGAFYVASSIVLLPRLGATALIGLAIAGQLVSSLVFDHWGWMGVPVHAMNAPRLMGAACLAIGIGLILRY